MWIAVDKLWKGGKYRVAHLPGGSPGEWLTGEVSHRSKKINMATAGYSGTPLIKKLGIKEETKVQLINAPDDYFKLLEADITTQIVKGKATPDIAHVFVKSYKEFEAEMKKIKPILKSNPNLTIWVSWYKKSAGIPNDVTEDVIRAYALKNDLVDVKVCAVSDIWSGLKLVVPVAKR